MELFYEGMTKYATDHNGTLDGYTRTQPNFMAVQLVKTFLDKDSQPLQVKSHDTDYYLSGGS